MEQVVEGKRPRADVPLVVERPTRDQPVGVENAVEVVALVLEDAGLPSRAHEGRVGLTVGVDCLDRHAAVAEYEAASGDATAPAALHRQGRFLANGPEDRGDQHQPGNRAHSRSPSACAGRRSQHAAVSSATTTRTFSPHLRRGQADAALAQASQ